MPWFAFATGGWAMVMLVLFIMAIRLSYRIEKRSEGLRNTTGIPRKAMIFHTVFNISVSADPDTQAMRKRMLILLALSIAGIAAMGFVVSSGAISPSPAG